MSRTKYSEAYRKVLSHIVENCKEGERFFTVRHTAELFGISLQTAQKIISELKEKEIVETKRKSGIYIRSLPGIRDLSGTKILLLSGIDDPRFVDAFSLGIRENLNALGWELLYMEEHGLDRNTIGFGDYLISLYNQENAGGIIALAYQNAELAFYHAMSHGCLIISDIGFPNLPFLPSVQTDNKKHIREVVRRFARLGKKQLLVCSYWKEDNVRFRTILEESSSSCPGMEVKYVYLRNETSPAELYRFFRHFHDRKGVLSLDYAANHTVTPYFITHNISPHNNYIVYDNEDNFFNHPGLDPIEAAAPSLKSLGSRLAFRLVERIRNGEWSSPMQEMV